MDSFLQHEQALFQYAIALERGQISVIIDILARSEKCKILADMLTEWQGHNEDNIFTLSSYPFADVGGVLARAEKTQNKSSFLLHAYRVLCTLDNASIVITYGNNLLEFSRIALRSMLITASRDQVSTVLEALTALVNGDTSPSRVADFAQKFLAVGINVYADNEPVALAG